MQADSIKKTLGVSIGVCLICSILVCSAVVSLKAIQNDNKKIDKLKNILLAGDLLEENTNIEETFKSKIKSAVVDLGSGKEVDETDVLNAESFDIKTMARDPEFGMDIPSEKDLASIKRMPKNMVVYKVSGKDGVEKIILPLYGKGLWSTMYGFMALDKDLKTIKGFTFYEHGETPGLGGEVDNPKWKSQWNGKKAFDDNGEILITVIKGLVDPTNAKAGHQIDGLSGSTLTTRGIDNLIKFWLGKDGYGPYLKQLKGGGLNG
ncbi:MAG: Na(+)-translocating NADH-quinone reductase subunit C [Melioribacteraceae bacterium]|nr:Na(+)-translocating NADH-quinone reductase subunit C [Melioribacteraceae bacterium]